MSAIGPGDIVVKVRGSGDIIPLGKPARVTGLCRDNHGPVYAGAIGLIFAAYPISKVPGANCRCFLADNFRPLNDGNDDANLIAAIKGRGPVPAQPVKQPEPANA